MSTGEGDGERMVGLVRERFPDAVTQTGSMRNQHWIELGTTDLVPVCTWLHQKIVG